MYDLPKFRTFGKRSVTDHKATGKRKKNVGGERSDTDRHRMSGTVIRETTMTGMTDMIGTGIIVDGTRYTTGITPPFRPNIGKTTADMTNNPMKSIDTKRISIRNAI